MKMLADASTRQFTSRRGFYPAFVGAPRIEIAHPNLKHGDRCPACGQGNVYAQKEPKVLVRIVGQAPLGRRYIRSNGFGAGHAGRCSRPRSRKAWGRTSTTRRRRR